MNKISKEEMETHIYWDATDDFMTIYTTIPYEITKLKKMCKENEEWEIDRKGDNYIQVTAPKKLITLRKAKRNSRKISKEHLSKLIESRKRK